MFFVAIHQQLLGDSRGILMSQNDTSVLEFSCGWHQGGHAWRINDRGMQAVCRENTRLSTHRSNQGGNNHGAWKKKYLIGKNHTKTVIIYIICCEMLMLHRALISNNRSTLWKSNKPTSTSNNNQTAKEGKGSRCRSLTYATPDQ